MELAERAKSEFRKVLRDLIVCRFGSQTAFSERVNLSRYRISQIVNPTVPPTYSTIERVLDAFQSIEDRDRLYRAWQTAFAPMPRMYAPPADASDDEIIEYVATCRKLHDNGKIGYFFSDLGKLWHSLYKRGNKPSAAQAAGSLLTECWYLRDNRPQGLDVARKLETIAVQHRDLSMIGQSLWLQALGTRSLVPDEPQLAEPSFERLDAFSETTSQNALAFRHKVLRDGVLLHWAAIDRGSDDLSLLKERLSGFQESLAAQDNPVEVRLGKEVEARALVALGEPDEAHKALEIAFELAAEGSPFQYLKAGITKARLLLATQYAGCERLIAELIALADGQLWIHYGTELRRLRGKLHTKDNSIASRLVG